MAGPEPAAGLKVTVRLLPPLAGLLVAATVAASSGFPPARLLSWSQLLGAAAQRVFLVSLCCVITIAVLYRMLARSKSGDYLVHQMSLAAVWLAPLALFIHENSIWALAIVATFMILAAPSFLPPKDPPANFPPSPLLSLDAHSFVTEFNFKPALSAFAAMCVQISVLLVLTGRTLFAAALTAGSFLIWICFHAAYAPAHESHDSSSPLFQSRTVVLATLPVLVTVAGLLPFLRIQGGFGHSSGKYPFHFTAVGPRRGIPFRVTRLETSPARGSEGNTGIVLWPEKQVLTQLVVPAPLQESTSLANIRNPDPLVIPFNGVYWFFKAPDRQPPEGSLQAHASPDAVDIRSTDRRPLSIEAHEYFGQLIDLACCSRIQIAIRNADRYPETVTLELILVNTSLPSRPSQSLGTLMVKSTPPWSLEQKRSPISETLNFAIPISRSFRRFDEVKIIFRLDRARADAAAKIAIDHFVLVPRGL